MKKLIKSIVLIVFAAILIDQPAFAANKPGTSTLDYYNKNGIYYYNPSGDCDSSSGNAGRAVIQGSTAAEKVWSGLTSLGFTDEQAAGIMGNMQHESVSFNPAQHEGSQYKKYWPMDLGANADRAYGLGLIQWSFGRRINMYNYVKEQAPDYLKYFNTPESYSMYNGNIYGMNGDRFIEAAGSEAADKLFSMELTFLYDELNSHKSYKGIFDQKTVYDSAKFFLEHVEIPKNPTIEHHMDRAEDAEKWYNEFHGKTISGGTTYTPSTSADNRDYESRDILTSNEQTTILKYKEYYQEIVSGTSIPWQAIAAIHYREGFTMTSNDAGGIFHSTTKTYATGEVSSSTFIQMGKDAVNDRLFIYSRGTVFSNEKNVKNFFFLFDGASEKYKQQARDLGFSETDANVGEGDPYVINKADQQRDPKHNTTSWGEIKDGKLTYPAGEKYGAFLVFKALGGLTTGTGCNENSFGAGNMSLNETALKYAWPVGDPHVGTMTPTEAYKEAYTKVGLGYVMPGGSSCDVFVATVARTSGVDPDFACCGVQSSSIPHLERSDKWEEITYSDPKDTSFLRPGDVLTVPGHIKMYVEKDGKGYIAQASYGNHSGELTERISLVDSLGRGNYRVWRFKG